MSSLSVSWQRILTLELSLRITKKTSCHFLFNHFGVPTLQNSIQFSHPNLLKVKVTLRLTVSQSVSLGVEPHLGIMTRFLLLFESYGLVFVRRPLWREDGSVFCICCWPSPAQSFSGPSPLGLAIIFCCLRFENSLFVASYDSQVHGGGIRPRIHTGLIYYCISLVFIRLQH
jgi:hypothetical protein